MPTTLKGLVSKKKIRFQKDGFDLDLTYITNNIIAMGYPAQSWEGIYRNHIDDVVSFFKKRHEGHYQIYNLCNERHIDEQKFDPDTINHSYPFDDHNPPRFSKMIKCCKDIIIYLNQNASNIVAVQCKAGKGRTGVIVCSCLLLQGHATSATDALQMYGKARTTNCKGVTIPSQIRYIYYFDYWHQNKLTYTDIRLKFNHLVIEGLPNIAGNGYEIQLVIFGYNNNEKMIKYHMSQYFEVKKDSQRSLKLHSEEPWEFAGDFKFQIVLKSIFGKRENLCHCWINTFFVVNKPPVIFLDDKSATNKLDVHHNLSRKAPKNNIEQPDRPKPTYKNSSKDVLFPGSDEMLYKLTLQKHEIDKANKDVNNKTFPPNFAMSFFFEKSSSDSSHISKNKDSRREIRVLDSKSSSIDGDAINTKHRNRVGTNQGAPLKDDYSDNIDEGSESSESSTKQTASDLEEMSN